MALVVLSADAKNLDKDEVKHGLIETMKDINTKLDKHEKMKKMVIMKEEWTVDNNLLTPTLKVKRNILEKKFEANYQKWYGTHGEVIDEQ